MAGNLQRQIRKISVRFVGKMLICKENTHSFSTVSPKIPKNARDTMGRGIVENGGENRKKHRKFSPNSTLRVLECTSRYVQRIVILRLRCEKDDIITSARWYGMVASRSLPKHCNSSSNLLHGAEMAKLLTCCKKQDKDYSVANRKKTTIK